MRDKKERGDRRDRETEKVGEKGREWESEKEEEKTAIKAIHIRRKVHTKMRKWVFYSPCRKVQIHILE